MIKKLFCFTIFTLACQLIYAENYRINIKRIDSNIYQTTNGYGQNIVIKTKYCYEYALNEDAVLIYDKYSYDNKLIFNNGTSCEVEDVV